MATTNNLVITLIEQSQSQKEVTANEAVTKIDAILNTGAKDKDLNTPPSTPSPGDVYIVGPSPTNEWTGLARFIAYYDQYWRFIIPKEGMTLWVNDEDIQYTWNGTAWVPTSNLTQFQNLTLLGVNATADSTNKLTVASSAVLFNNIGNGVQVKINKNASGDSSSFLYQTGFSGRAEFGTLGDDNFTLKVSSNGSTWYDVIKMIASTGRAAFKSIATGISAAGSTQATATAITKTFNEVTTVSANQGVRLPTPEAGEILMVANQGANTLNVYPDTGHTINSLAADAALSVATDTRKLFFAVTTSKWYSL